MMERELARSVIWLRLAQMAINERYKGKQFKVPIHLAFGHEAIAAAVCSALLDDDRLVLSHRNVHYNLLRAPSLRAVVDEYLLKEEGLARARHGSMNLANQAGGIAYTSSILGNNLPVAAGMAMANDVIGSPGVVFVVTGDGAMEEGAFYESLELLSTYRLRAVVLVEDNGWSLATRIQERRCPISLEHLARAFDAGYHRLTGNDPAAYLRKLQEVRTEVTELKRPALVEVQLSTLGDWRQVTPEHAEGKYINYHAGPAPSVELKEWPVLQEDDGDPVHVAAERWGRGEMEAVAREEMQRVRQALR